MAWKNTTIIGYVIAFFIGFILMFWFRANFLGF